MCPTGKPFHKTLQMEGQASLFWCRYVASPLQGATSIHARVAKVGMAKPQVEWERKIRAWNCLSDPVEHCILPWASPFESGHWERRQTPAAVHNQWRPRHHPAQKQNVQCFPLIPELKQSVLQSKTQLQGYHSGHLAAQQTAKWPADKQNTTPDTSILKADHLLEEKKVFSTTKYRTIAVFVMAHAWHPWTCRLAVNLPDNNVQFQTNLFERLD